jgi:hypothetical protein
MPAHVEQSMHLPVIVADDDDGITIDIVDEVVTCIGYLAGVAGKKPALAPDVLHLAAIDQFIMVKGSGQSVPGLFLTEKLLETE